MPAGSSDLHRWRETVVVVALVAAALVFWRPLFDNFALAKATVAWLAAVLLVGLTVVPWLLDGEIRIPRSPFVTVCGVFVGALSLSVATSSSPATSFVGVHGRWTGLVSYVSYVVFGLAALRHASGSFVERLLRGLLYSGVAVSLYALVQAAGMDPFVWSADDVPDVFSTLGNVNFASAFVALTFPPALWYLGRRRSSAQDRWVGAAALATGWPALVVIGSLQGYVVGAVGVALMALGVGDERFGVVQALLRRRPVQVTAVLAGLVAVVAAVSAWDSSVGRLGTGFEERLFFYDAAAAIVADHPIVGTGLDTFGRFFTRYQPVAHAVRFPEAVPDAPHSVPLGMFVHGGLVLGLVYVAVVAYVGWRLIGALRRHRGEDRLLLLTVGTVWLGYQVQSLVSMDVPPLALVHWVTAGAIIGLAESPTDWTYRLPWGPRMTKRGKTVRRNTAPPPAARLGAGVVVVALLAVAWLATRPARADRAAAQGRGFGALAVQEQRAVGPAEEAFERAHELAPHNGTYWFEHARTRYARGDVEGALQAQAEAARLAPGQPLYAVNAAIYALELGDRQAARAWWEEAISRDPRNPDRLTAAARFFQAEGDREEAAELQRRAEVLRSALQ